MRGHVIELDGDAPRGDARFLQRIGEEVGGIFSELIVGADVAETRARAREILLDVDDDLRREGIARNDRDGTAESVAGVARHQEAGRVSHVVLGERDQCVVARLPGGGAQLGDDFMLHRHVLVIRLR